MSHTHRTTYNDALVAHIDDYAERNGFATFNDAIRQLVVLGLAVDYQRRHLTIIDNPFFSTSSELLKP